MIGPMVAGIYAADPHTLELEARSAPRRTGKGIPEPVRRDDGPPSRKPRGHLETLPEARAPSRPGLTGAVHCEVEVGVVHTTTGPRPCDAVVLFHPAPAAGETGQWRLDGGSQPARCHPLRTRHRGGDGMGGWRLGGPRRLRCARGTGRDHRRCRGGPRYQSSIQIFGGRQPGTTLRGPSSVEPSIPGCRLDEQHLFQPDPHGLADLPRSDARRLRVGADPRHLGASPSTRMAIVRVARIRSAQSRRRGLVFGGGHLEGVGVKDCARAAEVAADAIDKALGWAARGARSERSREWRHLMDPGVDPETLAVRLRARLASPGHHCCWPPGGRVDGDAVRVSSEAQTTCPPRAHEHRARVGPVVLSALAVLDRVRPISEITSSVVRSSRAPPPGALLDASNCVNWESSLKACSRVRSCSMSLEAWLSIGTASARSLRSRPPGSSHPTAQPPPPPPHRAIARTTAIGSGRRLLQGRRSAGAQRRTGRRSCWVPSSPSMRLLPRGRPARASISGSKRPSAGKEPSTVPSSVGR